jgi:spermidine synthase
MRFEISPQQSETATKEMLSFVPLCTHENPAVCLTIGGELPNAAAKLARDVAFVAELLGNSGFESEKFDIVVSFKENQNLQEIFRILKKDGIFCTKISSDVKKELENVGNYFRIAMPYSNTELIFASNKYHPTADLILDKSDFVEECEYYNSDIHIASFAVYEKAKKALKGIIKN